MAHKCPKCGGPVQRGCSSTAQIAAGIVGALFSAAFGPFKCNKCGKIAQEEFPEDVRKKISRDTLLLALGGIVLAFVFFGFLTSR